MSQGVWFFKDLLNREQHRGELLAGSKDEEQKKARKQDMQPGRKQRLLLICNVIGQEVNGLPVNQTIFHGKKYSVFLIGKPPAATRFTVNEKG